MQLIYTDGAHSSTRNQGGWAFVVIEDDKEIHNGYGSVKNTTNNRMELLAVLEGLKKLTKHPLEVKVFTDSKYVADAFLKNWVFGWEKKNFSDRKNADLWKALLIEYRKHNVSFHWVKGHNNHPQNERCDRLAVAASFSKEAKEDKGYIEV
jgi:ribonuclease HI